MKKIALVLALLVGLIVASCSKDDDSTPNVVGKWNISKQGIFTNSVESLADYVHEANCNKDYMQLNADGTMIDGEFSSASSPCQELKTIGTYTLKDNKLSLNNDGGTRNFDVIIQTDSELKIRASNGETILFSKN
jgi:Lipocalin-like domain